MTQALDDLLFKGQSAFNFWIVTAPPPTLPQGVVALDIQNGSMYYMRPSTSQLMEVKLKPKVV